MNLEPTNESQEESSLNSSKLNKEKYSDNDCYACPFPNCRSDIEILYIDENDIKLAFKCVNNSEHNYIENPMLIKDFLKSCENNTYLFDKCSKCGKIQKEEADKFLFNYCPECKIIICNNCINNSSHEHNLIKNNERNIKCQIHPKNYNIIYCFNCGRHCCNECLKSKTHRGHIKDNINEICPSNNEIDDLKNSVISLDKKKEELIKEKEAKIVETKSQLDKEKEKCKNFYDNNIKKFKKQLKEKNDILNKLFKEEI